jgi:hypothetical protein
MLGLREPESHPVQDPQLGVRGLDERVGELVAHGRLDPGEVLADLPAQLDEGGDPAPLGPSQPGVDHGDGLPALQPDGRPELFLEQVRPVQAGVGRGDPDQLGLLGAR